MCFKEYSNFRLLYAIRLFKPIYYTKSTVCPFVFYLPLWWSQSTYWCCRLQISLLWLWLLFFL